MKSFLTVTERCGGNALMAIVTGVISMHIIKAMVAHTVRDSYLQGRG